MIALVVAALALVGGTTWLALNQPTARNPVRHHRLTGLGLALCLATAAAAFVGALVHLT